MSRRSERWLGSLVLATASLWFLASFVGRMLAALRSAQQLPLLWVGTAAAFLYAVARFWLWRRAAGRPGASLLLWSALLGLSGGMMLFSWLGPRFGAEPIILIYADAAVGVAALALLSAGLLRTGLVPVWVASIGLVAAALHLLSLLLHGLAGPMPSLLASASEVAFLFAVAGSLLSRQARPSIAEAPAASAL